MAYRWVGVALADVIRPGAGKTIAPTFAVSETPHGKPVPGTHTAAAAMR